MVRPDSRAECDELAVHFDAVTKRFGDVVALNEVSLAIGRGEFMTLLGPSGCGKTTLLKLAGGFLGPDADRLRSMANASTMCRPTSAGSA